MPNETSQSLLHQGIGRTTLICAGAKTFGLSPFFIRASGGRMTIAEKHLVVSLSPFFIRASGGRIPFRG